LGGGAESFTAFQRAKLADALESVDFPDSAKIVTQGDQNADMFYIVEKVRNEVNLKLP